MRVAVWGGGGGGGVREYSLIGYTLSLSSVDVMRVAVGGGGGGGNFLILFCYYYLYKVIIYRLQLHSVWFLSSYKCMVRSTDSAHTQGGV